MKVLCLAVLLGLLSPTLADPPILLDKESFASAINANTGKPHFVKFFAPWCGHCKRLAPTWDELAEKFTGTQVAIAKVDCTQETELCSENGVKGYPTLKLFKQSGEEVKYQGQRDIDSLTAFVTEHTGEVPPSEGATEAEEVEEEEKEVEEIKVDETGLIHLTDSNFQTFISEMSGIHFVKFYAPWCGHCKRLAPTWDELAEKFKDESSVNIVKVDCTQEKETCQRQGVRGYPTLVLFADGLAVEKYSGSRTLDDLVTFITDNMAGEEEEAKGPVELTEESFPVAIAEGFTFVKFYAPWCGHCKKLAPTWEELALKVHASSPGFQIAKVNCVEEKDLCQEYGVRGYPTLLLFKDGEKVSDYRQSRDLNTLLSFVEAKQK